MTNERATEPTTEPASEPASEPAALRPRVLVIDDDRLFQKLVVSLLRGGFETAVAGDGESGYYKALEWRPQLVLIDHRMPGWDGLLTLRKLRAHPLLADVKTVMLTADTSRETVLRAIRYGVNDYVVKTSFTREELWGKVGMLLGRQDELPAPPPPAWPTAPDAPDAPARPADDGDEVDAATDAATDCVAGAAAATVPPAAVVQQLIDNWE